MKAEIFHNTNKDCIQIKINGLPEDDLRSFLYDHDFSWNIRDKSFLQKKKFSNTGFNKILKSLQNKEYKKVLSGVAKKVSSRKKASSLTGLDQVNEQFNTQLSLYQKGNTVGRFSLGIVGSKLAKAGFEKVEIELLKSVLSSKIEKHNISFSELRNLPQKIHSPIMVFHSDNETLRKQGAKVVLIDLNRTVVACHLRTKRNGISFYNIASIHKKDHDGKIKNWIDKGLLIWEDKKRSKAFSVSQAPIARGGEKTLDSSNITKSPKKSSSSSKKDQGLNGALSFEEASKGDFNPVPISDKYRDIMGKFELPTHIFISGEGGNGKTGMVLKFIEELATLGHKALFVSGEQISEKEGKMYVLPTLRNLINEIGIDTSNPNLSISDKFDGSKEGNNPSNYDIVVIDSKDSFSMSPEGFKALTKQHPNTSFILLSQSNKDGSYSGAGKWRNEVDIMLEAHERGKMRTGAKNRWDQFGEVRLFGKDENPKQTQL